jgi:Tol biopolymer transport system component
MKTLGLLLGLAASAAMTSRAAPPALGLFTDEGDIGDVRHAGAAKFDPARGTYTITGGGENMWFARDAFHCVWKRASGDLSLAADIRWPGPGGHPHRKACLVIRQSLDPDSPYVDAALHGSGLTSLQYRATPGGPTHEIQSNVTAPLRLRIEKRGGYVSISVALADAPLESAGGSVRLQFEEPFYVGLAVCAHDNNAREEAVFADVELATVPPPAPNPAAIQSALEIVDLASQDRRVVYHTNVRIEAPNWSRDGQTLIFNSGGRLYRLAVTGGTPQLIDTGLAVNCNNDHGLSPDGTQLAISDQTGDNQSRVYVLPLGGGIPRRVTILGPSYWHGWSPDGQTLAYCAERHGEFDVYTIPVAGGAERRLTTAPGLDDGPEYSPDGRYIYFNSDRTGLMQIWRMRPDGSGQEPVTADEYNNWFAHLSPDGKWIVFLSYPRDVKGHPANQDVMLRLLPAAGGEIRVLATLYGGQGTINVPSWSPDNQSVAFVSYQPLPF